MHTKKPQLKHAAIPAAVALALGAAMAAVGVAQAARVIVGPEQVYRSSNFTMLSSGGGQVGGTNDVTGFWDGTAYNSQSDIPMDLTTGTPNAVIQSPTKFFGAVWTAATVMVFAPGTYTFTEDNDTNTATWDTGGPSHTMTVDTGQLGAHMLFNWSSSHNIGVVDVWDKNVKFGPSALWTGALVTADPWSGKTATAWTLMSGLAADDPAHPNINGEPMVNGPFNGFNANFNLHAVNTGPTANNDSCAAALPPASTTCTVLTNDVAQSGFAIAPATVKIQSGPSRGTALANLNGTVTYTPGSGVTGGTDSFTYTVRDDSTVGYNETTLSPDGKGLRSNLATVTVSVDTPAAGAVSAHTPQNGSVVVDVLSNDSAPSGTTLDPASVTVTTLPTVGTAVPNTTTGKITYTPPNAGYTGLVTFQYTVANSASPPRTSPPATVTVQVQGTGIGADNGMVSAGSLATSQGIPSGMMTAGELQKAGVPSDSHVVKECVGGCFDFKLSNVSTPTASVVLKLSAAIPSNPGYQKWNGNQWVGFSTTAPNALFSAPLAKSGDCPAAGDAAYTTGLKAGNHCVELVIQDNGPNDQNSAMGTIADPGGVAQLPIASAAVQVTPTPPGMGGGCTLAANGSPWRGGAWWLTGGLLGWMGFSRRRRSSRPS